MDNRRWNTAQGLAGGVLNIAPPKSKCPDGLLLAKVDDDFSSDSLRAGLEAGGLEASMYYGCWLIWRNGEGFDGELMQYRAVTDQFSGLNLDGALDKAEEWAAGCYG